MTSPRTILRNGPEDPKLTNLAEGPPPKASLILHKASLIFRGNLVRFYVVIVATQFLLIKRKIVRERL